MPAPQLADYPEALQVFEDNNLEAFFETREEDNEVILKVKEMGGYRWNKMQSIPIDKLPNPSDKEATKVFWDRMWHSLEVYPIAPVQYSIPSEVTWISMRTKQPDDNQPVLVYGELPMGNGKRALIATYRKSRNEAYPSSFDYATHDFRTVSLTNVTHWLPIPDLPSRRSAE